MKVFTLHNAVKLHQSFNLTRLVRHWIRMVDAVYISIPKDFFNSLFRLGLDFSSLIFHFYQASHFPSFLRDVSDTGKPFCCPTSCLPPSPATHTCPMNINNVFYWRMQTFLNFRSRGRSINKDIDGFLVRSVRMKILQIVNWLKISFSFSLSHRERGTSVRGLFLYIFPNISMAGTRESIFHTRSFCCRTSDKLDSLIFYSPWNFTSQSCQDLSEKLLEIATWKLWFFLNRFLLHRKLNFLEHECSS